MVSSLASVGSTALMRSYSSLQKNAQQIASSTTNQSSSTLSSGITAQQAVFNQAMADVQLVTTAEKMLGTVIDTRA